MRPRRGFIHHHGGWVAGVAVLAAAVHGFTAFWLSPILVNDSVWYLNVGGSAQGVSFDPYAALDHGRTDAVYPVGYPYLLHLGRLLFGWHGLAVAVVALQHALAASTAVLLAGLGRELSRPRSGAVAGGLYALSASVHLYAQVLISETVYTFLVVAATLVLVRWRAARRPQLLVGLGVVVGLACVTRPAALPLVGLVTLVAVVSAGSGTRLAALLRVGLPVVVLLLVSLAHHHVRFGTAGLVTATGRHLINRVWGQDRTVVAGPATAAVLDHCRRSGLPHRIPGAWWEFWAALRLGSGLDASAADRLLLRAALESIAAEPARYATYTVRGLIVVVGSRDEWLPSSREMIDPQRARRLVEEWSSQPGTDLERGARERMRSALRLPRDRSGFRVGPIGERIDRALGFWARGSARRDVLVAVVGLLAMLGMARRTERESALILLLIVVGVLVPAALFEHAYARYRFPAMPLLLLSACLAGGAMTEHAQWLVEATVRRWRLRARARPVRVRSPEPP